MEQSGPTHRPLGDWEEHGPLGGWGKKAKTVIAFFSLRGCFFCPKSEFWGSILIGRHPKPEPGFLRELPGSVALAFRKVPWPWGSPLQS